MPSSDAIPTGDEPPNADAPSAPDDREDLLALAGSLTAEDRERLLFALVDLCEARAGAGRPLQARASLLFEGLVGLVATDARQRLSERLAPAPWTPHELVLRLCCDVVEVARPLIGRSPVLGADDLVRLVGETSTDHGVEIAARPGLPSAAVDALLDYGAPEALTALARNGTAEVGPAAMQRLAAASEAVPALRAPLARHPALSSDQGAVLYGWCGEALRRVLRERFTEDTQGFEAAAIGKVAASGGRAERAGMERRVVQKLGVAGELRPGLLLRALHDGQLTLFSAALAELGGYEADQVRRALDAGVPDLLALACAGVGVDRSAWPDLLSMARRLNAGRPGTLDGGPGLRAPNAPLTPAAARQAFVERAGPV